MNDKQEKLLHDLEVRMKQLMFLCDSLKEENLQMKEDLKQKNAEIETLSSGLIDIQTRYENLKISKAFVSGGNNGDPEVAKAKLAKLVQDVDKCISLLKS